MFFTASVSSAIERPPDSMKINSFLLKKRRSPFDTASGRTGTPLSTRFPFMMSAAEVFLGEN
jgi:hypothetical protein